MDKGRAAFVYFHNRASRYPDYNYTLDEALKTVSRGEKNIGFFTDGIGGLIREIQSDGFLSGNKVKNAMENLADKGAGKKIKVQSIDPSINGEWTLKMAYVSPGRFGQIVLRMKNDD